MHNGNNDGEPAYTDEDIENRIRYLLNPSFDGGQPTNHLSRDAARKRSFIDESFLTRREEDLPQVLKQYLTPIYEYLKPLFVDGSNNSSVR